MNNFIVSEKSNLSATASDKKQYQVRALSASYAMSSVFEIQLKLAAETFEPSKYLGSSLSVTWSQEITGTSNVLRHFNGHIVDITSLPSESDSVNYYEVTLRPWLWLLKFNQVNRIFQNESLKGILTEIFDTAGFKGCYKFLSMPSKKRVYCTQFNESDLEFAERIMAEEGVTYYFDHDERDHNMVIKLSTAAVEKNKKAQFDYFSTRTGTRQVLTGWEQKHFLTGNSVTLTGYDYKKPTKVKVKKQSSNSKVSNFKNKLRELFGILPASGSFNDLAPLAAQFQAQQDSHYEDIVAVTDSNFIEVGKSMHLSSHPDKVSAGDYLVNSAVFSIDLEKAAASSFRCEFHCRAVGIPFTPDHRDKPRAPGLMSAVVVSETGTIDDSGSINQDDMGRVRLDFLWDNNATHLAGCWVRVAQIVAGSKAGMQFVPRIGDEVLVDFMGGDIDQPIVVGSVYNGTNEPLYPTKDSTQSGIRTALEGEANEICFDDKKDEEKLAFNAAKDFDLNVKNNATAMIDGDAASTVKKTSKYTVEDTLAIAVTNGYTHKAKTVKMSAEDKIELIVGSSKLTITPTEIKISCDTLEVTSEKDSSFKALGFKISSELNTEITAKAKIDIKATAQANLSGDAGVNVTTPAMAKLEGKAGAEVNSSAMTKVGAAAITEISGGLVKIN